MTARVIVGDCLAEMEKLEAESVDAVVTDPPYGLGFMGKSWDTFSPEVVAKNLTRDTRSQKRKGMYAGKASGAPSPAMAAARYDARADDEFQRFMFEMAVAAFRVAKPGAHLVAFGSPRRHHRLMCALEDAGWEIRDCLMWLFGSGFPKSLDVSKAIDKAAGAERADLGVSPNWRESKRGREEFGSMEVRGENAGRITAPATDAARQWDGWGTALKPAYEPIILARKPLAGTVAANVLAHGTGALNIDGCRIATADDLSGGAYGADSARSVSPALSPTGMNRPGAKAHGVYVPPAGRWPANVVLDQDAAAQLDQQAPAAGAFAPVRGTEPSRPFQNAYGEMGLAGGAYHGDAGGASRFFYTSKASRAERNAGLEDRDAKPINWSSGTQNPGSFQSPNTNRSAKNHHPTVKPLDLMQWLCRLVTPKGGLILDPFCGSGTTGRAAIAEGFQFIGIELEPEYAEIARARIRDYAPLLLDTPDDGPAEGAHGA